MREDTEFLVKKIVGLHLRHPVGKISSKKSFENLGADSLDLIEMLMEVEENFEVSISDKDAEKFKTIKDVVDYLEAL